jgi:hypothetical protein
LSGVLRCLPSGAAESAGRERGRWRRVRAAHRELGTSCRESRLQDDDTRHRGVSFTACACVSTKRTACRADGWRVLQVARALQPVPLEAASDGPALAQCLPRCFDARDLRTHPTISQLVGGVPDQLCAAARAAVSDCHEPVRARLLGSLTCRSSQASTMSPARFHNAALSSASSGCSSNCGGTVRAG